MSLGAEAYFRPVQIQYKTPYNSTPHFILQTDGDFAGVVDEEPWLSETKWDFMSFILWT